MKDSMKTRKLTKLSSSSVRKTSTILQKITLLAVLGLVAFSLNAQTIITIDNNPGSTTTYQNIQDAHDAAAAGDIIYVQPSPTSYGALTTDKAITVVGRSHSEFNNVSTIAIVTIRSSDVTLKGLSMSTVNVYSSAIGIPISNLNLYECKLGGLSLGHSVQNYQLDGLEARGCVIAAVHQYAGAQNILISNNIITGGLTVYNPSSIVVANNIFRTSSDITLRNYATGETAILYNNMFILNSTSDRNILFGTGDWNVSNNLLYNYADTYNLDFGTSGTGTYSDSNTLLNVDPLFTNVDATDSKSLAGTSTYDVADRVLDDMSLQAGSPALTGGGGGSEIGLFNSGFIYKNIGNPRGIPTIDITTYDGAVPKNGSINVTITAKAH